MRKVIFLIVLVFIPFSVFSYDMVDDTLSIDFSPSTTNLVYDLQNVVIDTSNKFINLGGGYSSFKITNIKIDKNKNEFFYNMFVGVNLTPQTVVECYVVDGKRKSIVGQFNLTSSERAYFFNLYDILPKSLDEIYLVFSSYTTSPTGGRVFLITLTKQVVLEGSVNDNEVKVYPNPVMVRGGDIPKIIFKLPKTSYTTLVIFDSGGNIVRTISKEQMLEEGTHIFTWDLKDDKGKDVPSGKYILFSKIENISSTFSFLVIR